MCRLRAPATGILFYFLLSLVSSQHVHAGNNDAGVDVAGSVRYMEWVNGASIEDIEAAYATCNSNAGGGGTFAESNLGGISGAGPYNWASVAYCGVGKIISCGTGSRGCAAGKYSATVFAYSANACGINKRQNSASGSCVDEDKTAGDTCSSASGQPTAGNPVNLANGNKIQIERDFDINGLSPIEFVRIYNSNNRSYGPAGYGWTHSYQRSLVDTSGDKNPVGTSMQARRPDGKVYNFFLGDPSRPYIADADIPATLEKYGTGWIYRDIQNGLKETYDSNGRLLSIKDAQGANLLMTYGNTGDAAGKITSISDDFGNSLVLTYRNGGFLQSVGISRSNITLREFRYDIDSDGALKRVIYPDGTDRSYLYNENTYTSGKNLPYALTGIVDNGIRFATYQYDSSRRAISTTHADGVGRFDIDYTNLTSTIDSRTQSTQVSGISGNTDAVVTYHFLQKRGKRVISSLNGEVATGCVASNTTYTYDDFGYRASETQVTTGKSRAFQHDQWGRLTRIDEGLDSSGKPTSNSVRKWIEYNTSPAALAATNLPLRERYLAYTGSGYTLLKTVDYSYTSNNRVASITETDGTTISTPYNTNGRSHTWSYTYSYFDGNTRTQLQKVFIKDPEGNTTNYLFTQDGLLASETNALGQTTTFGYDYAQQYAYGRPVSITDPNGLVTQFTYDPRGRMISRRISDGETERTTLIDYWPNGLMRQITHPDGSTESYEYNPARQLTAWNNSFGDRIEVKPGKHGGWLEALYYHSGQLVTRQRQELDALGRTMTIIDADEKVKARYAFDENNQLRNIIEEGGDESRINYLTYDALGRLTQETVCAGSAGLQLTAGSWLTCDNSGSTTTYQYDYKSSGKLVQSVIDAAGHTTGFEYDGFGMLIRETSPVRSNTIYRYDRNGNLTMRKQAAGTSDELATYYTWDPLNRLLTVDYPDSDQDIAYKYDSGTTSAGPGISCGPGAIGRLCAVADNNYPATTSYVPATDYAYNRFGDLITEASRPDGLATDQNHKLQTSYSYNSAGNLQKITYPSGRTVSTPRSQGRLDPASDITTSFNSVTQSIARGVTYLPFGKIASFEQVLARGSLNYRKDIDSNNQMSGWRVQLKDSKGKVTSSVENTLSRDDFGRITALSQDGAPRQIFTYDILDHLSSATGPYGKYEYTYDNVGNRLTRIKYSWDGNSPDKLIPAWKETYNLASDGHLASVTKATYSNGTFGNPNFSGIYSYDSRGNTTRITGKKIQIFNYGNNNRIQSTNAQ